MALDLLGKKFGNLLVKSRIDLDHKVGNPYKWLCTCDCGKECTPTGPHLVRGDSTSCGGCKWKDRAFRQILAEYKVGAKRRELSWALSDEDFRELTSSPCHYTGRLPDKTRNFGNDAYLHNGIDRIDSSKGYTTENCVPCCEAANRAKLEMSYKEFLSLCAEVTNNVRKEISLPSPETREHYPQRGQ